MGDLREALVLHFHDQEIDAPFALSYATVAALRAYAARDDVVERCARAAPIAVSGETVRAVLAAFLGEAE